MPVLRKLMVGVGLWLAVYLTAQAGSVTYIYSDPQGTPLAEADGAGNITATFDYAPYGVEAMGSSPQGPGYTGHVKDPDTGLIYMQARYFDPLTGRFASVDPEKVEAGEIFSSNRFAYAHDNPIRYVDPDGRKIEFAQGSSEKFKKSFADAVKYLNKGKVSQAIAAVEKSSTVVTLQEAVKADDDHYSPDTKTVVWDPNSALKTTNGGLQTPALGVLHEFGHADGDLNKKSESTTPDGTPYDNKEEKRVIDNMETPSAKKLGEGTRTDHAGQPYKVDCVSCTK